MNKCIGVALAAVTGFAFGEAAADSVKAKDWSWNVEDPGMVYAETTNAAGHVLGQFCYPKTGNCLYLVGFKLTCDKGSKYPALVNTDEGAQAIEFVCGDNIDGQNVMIASDFDLINNLISDAKRIGFVIPMEGDEFKAVRFSLRGSQEAITLMRAAALRLQESGSHADSKTKPAVEKL